MKDRIIEFLKMENKSSAQFADEISVQPSSVSHIISGRNNPSLDFVMKMLTRYPVLSAEWLLFGKGEMYKEPQLHNLFETEVDNNDNHANKPQENTEDDNYWLRAKKTETDSGSLTERNTGSNYIKTKRIICFFNDDTFKEYFPDNK